MKKQLFTSLLGLSLLFFKQGIAEEPSLLNRSLLYLLPKDLEPTLQELLTKQLLCLEIAQNEVGETIHDTLSASYPYFFSIATSQQWLIASKLPIEETTADKTFRLFSIQSENELIAHLCLAQTENATPSELSRIVDIVDTLLEESDAPCLFCGAEETVEALEHIYREKIVFTPTAPQTTNKNFVLAKSLTC